MTGKLAAILPDVKLQPHQERVRDRVASDPRARVLLLHGLGSGKSLSGLAAAEAAGEPYTFVAPASLRQNALKERKKFTDEQTPADLVSYSELALGKRPERLGTLVLDESQSIKNPESARTQAVRALAERAKRVVMLSATPIANSPREFAVPFSLLTGRDTTPDEFEGRYVGTKSRWPGFLAWLRGVEPAEEPAVANREELKQLLEGKVDYYAPARSDVAVNHTDVPVEMSSEQSRLYRAMWDKLPWLLKWKLQHDYPLTDDELRRSTSFLTGPRQVGLSTLPYLRDKDPHKAFNQSAKLRKAMELLQDKLQDPTAKALVFSNFVDAGLRPYAAALERSGIPHGVFYGGLSDAERKRLVDDYNADKLRVALLGPSGMEGLSFKGTRLVQQLDPYWNSVRPRQAEGRGVRYDSHWHLPEELRNVEVQRFIARLPPGLAGRLLRMVGLSRSEGEPAVDEHLIAMSDRKDRLNQQFVDLLKEIGSRKQAAALDDPRAVAVGLPAAAGAIGALTASDTGSPTQLALGAGGGLAAHLAARKLFEQVVGPQRPRERSEEEIDEMLGAGPPGIPTPAASSSPYSIAARRRWIPRYTQALERFAPKKAAADDVLPRLLAAKQLSDVRNYAGKQAVMRALLLERPDEFYIDSEQGNIVGITHRNGFRIHLPRRTVPPNIRNATGG